MSTHTANRFSCPSKEICGGCQTLGQTQEAQHEGHRQALFQAWQSAQLPILPKTIHIFGAFIQASRSVAEFSFRRYPDRTAMGWFHQGHDTLQPLNDCPALVSSLRPLFQYLTQTPPPIDRCTFRIRAAPNGQLGCWIDAANIDIATLLKEQAWLRKLMTHCLVEMGQKHKLSLIHI